MILCLVTLNLVSGIVLWLAKWLILLCLFFLCVVFCFCFVFGFTAPWTPSRVDMCALQVLLLLLLLAFFSCFMKMDPRRIRTVGENKQGLLSSRVRLSTKIACLLCHTWMVFFMLNITAKKVVKKYLMVKQCNAIWQK